MGVFRKLPAQRDQEAPSHPEVNQENETAFEPDNYIFATSIDGCDALAFELSGDLLGVERTGEPFVQDLDRDERAAGEDRRQLRLDRLDLGQLRHFR
jgi:hypothetical protein